MRTEFDSEFAVVAFELENGARYTFTYKGVLAGVIALFSVLLFGAGGTVVALSYFSNPTGLTACTSSNEEIENPF